MIGAVTSNAPRRAYRRREVCEIYGASLSAVDKAIRDGLIRTKRAAGCVYLAAQDVERLYDPLAPVEIRPEDIDDLRGLLS